MVPPLHQITYLARLVPVQTPKPLDIHSLTLATLTKLTTNQFVNVMMNILEPGATNVQITIMEIQKCQTGNVSLVTAMKIGSKMLKVTELCLKYIFRSLVSSRMLPMIKYLSMTSSRMLPVIKYLSLMSSKMLPMVKCLSLISSRIFPMINYLS